MASISELVTRNIQNTKHIVTGRVRYMRAVRTVMKVERIYRHTRNKAEKTHNEAQRDQLWSRAHAQAARLARELCQQNGATWVKMAQFFSCRPDILPREFIEELQRLQNEAQPIPFELLIPTLRRHFGEHWSSHFRSFDAIPVATASIAQVHKAQLNTGEWVAVKVLQPEVHNLFQQDVATMKLVASMLAPLIKEVDIKQVFEQLIKLTMEELDFRNEARNIRDFMEFNHIPRVRTPRLFEELSGEEVLVTSWEDGQRLRDYLDTHSEEAEDLLTVLLQSYIQQVTSFGVYHADPHPGNFLVTDNKEIVILDFGALARLTPDEVQNYATLLFSLMSGHTDNLGELFEKAGFKGGNADTLAELAQYVLSDRMDNMDFAESLQDLLQKFREKRVEIPDSYIAMARVLITVGGFLMHYKVPFKWLPAPSTA